MEKHTKSFNHLVYILVVIAVMLSIIIGFDIYSSKKFGNGGMMLSYGWDVEYGAIKEEDLSIFDISDPEFTHLPKGSTLVLSTTLPPNTISFPTLLIEVNYSSFEVLLGGKRVYTWKSDEFSKGNFIGYTRLFISLPSNAAGKELRLVYRLSDSIDVAAPSVPIYGEYDMIMSAYLQKNLINYMVGIFAMVYGLTFFTINIIFLRDSANSTSQILSAILSFDAGFWMLCYYGFFSYILPGSDVTFYEYAALYLVVPLMLLMVKTLSSIKFHNVFRDGGWAFIFFGVIFILLPMVGVIDINKFKILNGLIVLVTSFVLFVYSVINLIKRTLETSELIQLCGCSLMCLFIVVDYITVQVKNVFRITSRIPGENLFALGVFVFVMLQILNYFIYLSQSYAKQIENDNLAKVAYVDKLTGLNNRSGADRKMHTIQSIGDPFFVVSLDLNGLKRVNDNLGHASGDMLLREFCNYLNDVFDDDYFKGRMGGDEFIIITNNTDEDDLVDKLNTLKILLDEKTRVDGEIDYSCSFGYAMSKEADGSAHATYMLADSRMYEMKRAYYRAYEESQRDYSKNVKKNPTLNPDDGVE